MEKQLAVCVLAFNKNNKILAVSKRNTTDQFGLPGGKVEKFEDTITALIREVSEETHIYLHPDYLELEYCIIDEQYIVLTYIYKQPVTEIPKQGDAGAVDWVDWEDLISGPFGIYNQNLKNHLGL